MRAVVLGQIPHANASRPIATDDLSLVRVNYNIICRAPMVVTALDGSRSCLPDLDSSVFGAADHPLPLTVESNASDVPCMSLEGQ